MQRLGLGYLSLRRSGHADFGRVLKKIVAAALLFFDARFLRLLGLLIVTGNFLFLAGVYRVGVSPKFLFLLSFIVRFAL